MCLYICNINDFDDLKGLSFLTKERQARISRYHLKEDKLRCLCGGLLIRFLLGERADEVILGTHGKPCIPNEKLHFNLSHSGDYVVLASDIDEIGIDIEKIRPVPARVAERCFTADELKWLQSSPSERAFYMLWTAKESIMKATGDGFRMPPNRFSVLPVQNKMHHVNHKDWFLQWYDFDRHVICTASKTEQQAELCFLNRQALLQL